MGKNTQGKNILKREFSSGGVVYKKDNGKTLWLVRKTAASKLYPKQYWMLPKGRIDDTPSGDPGPMASGKIKADENSLQKAALKEVREETGIEARIIKKIGTSFYSFTNPFSVRILKFVTFYLMEYVSDIPGGYDWETEEVVWLEFEKAKKKLSFGGEKEILLRASDNLKNLEINLTINEHK